MVYAPIKLFIVLLSALFNGKYSVNFGLLSKSPGRQKAESSLVDFLVTWIHAHAICIGQINRYSFGGLPSTEKSPLLTFTLLPYPVFFCLGKKTIFLKLRLVF